MNTKNIDDSINVSASYAGFGTPSISSSAAIGAEANASRIVEVAEALELAAKQLRREADRRQPVCVPMSVEVTE